jgi:hypothetical protein
MTISCDVARFLPLLQSGPRLTFNTRGSAKPPPWAKFCNRFAVENSHTARHVSHQSPITSHLSPFFAVGGPGAPGVAGVLAECIPITHRNLGTGSDEDL